MGPYLHQSSGSSCDSERANINNLSILPHAIHLVTIVLMAANDPYAVFSPQSAADPAGGTPNDSIHSTDAFAGDPRYPGLSTELRNLLFAGAQTVCTSRAQTPNYEDDDGDPSTRPAVRPSIERSSTRKETPSQCATYMRVWSAECAPWLDMFDQSRAFGRRVPHLAQSSPPVFYSMLALAARQLERHSAVQMASRHSIEFYSQAIVELSKALETKDECILVTACILCVLEMMSASPRDWRRHLEGCAALFDAAATHGLCGGLEQAVFWCFARMDLCSAIISEGTSSTVLPVEKWVLPPGHEAMSEQNRDHAVFDALMAEGLHSADMHANFMVYLCARVCDLMAKRARYVELQESNGCDDEAFPRLWTTLFDQLRRWYENRPMDMQPVKTGKIVHHFPAAFYAHYAAISGTQLYHTACILMIDMHPPTTLPSPGRDDFTTALWHARCIVGISLHNQHRGCLNNAIQPLWVAGRMFTHKEEQVIIARLLDTIERSSGWAARWRIRDLESTWGYQPRAFVY